jgi:hypothetical protein
MLSSYIISEHSFVSGSGGRDEIEMLAISAFFDTKGIETRVSAEYYDGEVLQILRDHYRDETLNKLWRIEVRQKDLYSFETIRVEAHLSGELDMFIRNFRLNYNKP